MSEIIIRLFADGDTEAVREIFFESSSRKDFASEKERAEFEWKYLGYYLKNYSEYAWVAVNGEVVLGYLVASPVTATDDFFKLQPHLLTFRDEYQNFPAHLHMNMHYLSRGKGVGRLLMSVCLDYLRVQGVTGLHILTGKDSENRAFYVKSGLTYTCERDSMALHGIFLV